MAFRLLAERKRTAFHLAEQMLYLQLADGTFGTRRRRSRTNWNTVHRNTLINVVGTAHHFDGPVTNSTTFGGQTARALKKQQRADDAYLLINTIYLTCKYEVDEDIVPILKLSKAVNQVGSRGMKFWSPGMGLGDVCNTAFGEVIGAVTGGTNDMLIIGGSAAPGGTYGAVADLMKKTGGSVGALKDIGTGQSTGITGLLDVLSPIRTEITSEQQFIAIRRCNLILTGGRGNSGRMRASATCNVHVGPTSRALALAVTDSDDPLRNRTNYITNPFSDDPTFVPNQRVRIERAGLPTGYWINEQMFHARLSNGRHGWVKHSDTEKTGDDRNFLVSQTPPPAFNFTRASTRVQEAFESATRPSSKAADSDDGFSDLFSGSTESLSAGSFSDSYSASSSDSAR
ncbi:hypothetical protein MWU54_05940 [Marivita sp. S6314]|uniref:hypothetical protein n=1 Tax=Marivita sp. S6314 TaxID=2926406 RepID=UPI001FF219C3|nr:hypothetical protein [Marivita sp. S6314]MCK0149554.1 hypothetical protein [Marivita sp. S6314]